MNFFTIFFLAALSAQAMCPPRTFDLTHYLKSKSNDTKNLRSFNDLPPVEGGLEQTMSGLMKHEDFSAWLAEWVEQGKRQLSRRNQCKQDCRRASCCLAQTVVWNGLMCYFFCPTEPGTFCVGSALCFCRVINSCVEAEEKHRDDQDKLKLLQNMLDDRNV